MTQVAFQDLFPTFVNTCWGCGSNNQHGLQIKSYWSEQEEVAICTWQAEAYHTAGWGAILSGGIIASLIDCHSLWTAIMVAHQREGRAPAEPPAALYVTGSLQVSYLKPTPLGPVTLRAHIKETHPKKMVVACSVLAQDEECARGEVIAVRLPVAKA